VTSRNRVFLGLLGIFILAFAFLTYRIAKDLDPRYREPAEDSLIETAHLLATLMELDLQNGAIDVSRLGPAFQNLYGRRFSAHVYSVEKTRVELRVYVTDRTGHVVFDAQGTALGKDYSRWHDVSRTLEGRYGARTTNDVADDPRTATMYVGAPIWYADQIVGVVSVGRPVVSFGQYVQAARSRIVTAGVVSGATFLLLAVLLSVWLVRPVGLVAGYVRYLRREPGAIRPKLGRGALGAMAAAYQEMRDALAGRQYVTEYVQTLTHEIKSPLSAIRGAADLLQEPMPEEDRQRFVENIRREAARTQELVDRLLELAALERLRRLDRVEPVSLLEIARAAVRATEPKAQRRHVSVALIADVDVTLRGDPLLLASALTNLLENALDFSPEGAKVEIRIERVGDQAQVIVRDEGPGIPDYARGRVFERFYSLARPHAGKKGTGLGLAFVKEIAELHGGSASLDNGPQGGAVATLRLPLDPAA
jgi:two-component system, OmpR family, sensor histidine kinase CreC